MAYSDLLKDPRWQRKRLEVLNAANWRCHACGTLEKTLNVHHKKYKSGAMPWEYEIHELEVLCEGCHERVHQYRKTIHSLIDDIGPLTLGSILGYALANHGHVLSNQNLGAVSIDVRDWAVARGVSDAIGVFHVGSADEHGGMEWVMEKADVDGNINPKALHDELWEWWRVTENEFNQNSRASQSYIHLRGDGEGI